MSHGQPAGPGIAALRAERARWEFAWHAIRRAGAVLFVGLFTASAVWSQYGPRPRFSGRGLVVLALLVAVLLAFAAVHVTIRHNGVPSLVATGILIASSAALMGVQPTGPGLAGVYTGVLIGVLRLPWRWAVGWSVLSFCALVAFAAVTETAPEGTVAMLAFLGGFFGVVYMARRLSHATWLGERLLAELEEGRAAQARAAGLAERQRMAREMHDVLAHTLSGLQLQLEAARMLAVRGTTADPRLREIIDRAQHLGKSGLDEARQAIGMLRGDEPPGLERLAGLVAWFSANRSIPCRLLVSGSEHQLGVDAGLAVYRVAQEALTNITKHARPDRVEVRLAYLPDATRLTIEDFAAPDAVADVCSEAAADVPDAAAGASGAAVGNGTRPDFPKGGYGLTGMRERAELLGGLLRAVPTCMGFLVELQVPKSLSISAPGDKP